MGFIKYQVDILFLLSLASLLTCSESLLCLPLCLLPTHLRQTYSVSFFPSNPLIFRHLYCLRFFFLRHLCFSLNRLSFLLITIHISSPLKQCKSRQREKLIETWAVTCFYGPHHHCRRSSMVCHPLPHPSFLRLYFH